MVKNSFIQKGNNVEAKEIFKTGEAEGNMMMANAFEDAGIKVEDNVEEEFTPFQPIGGDSAIIKDDAPMNGWGAKPENGTSNLESEVERLKRELEETKIALANRENDLAKANMEKNVMENAVKADRAKSYNIDKNAVAVNSRNTISNSVKKLDKKKVAATTKKFYSDFDNMWEKNLGVWDKKIRTVGEFTEVFDQAEIENTIKILIKGSIIELSKIRPEDKYLFDQVYGAFKGISIKPLTSDKKAVSPLTFVNLMTHNFEATFKPEEAKKKAEELTSSLTGINFDAIRNKASHDVMRCLFLEFETSMLPREVINSGLVNTKETVELRNDIIELVLCPIIREDYIKVTELNGTNTSVLVPLFPLFFFLQSKYRRAMFNSKLPIHYRFRAAKPVVAPVVGGQSIVSFDITTKANL